MEKTHEHQEKIPSSPPPPPYSSISQPTGLQQLQVLDRVHLKAGKHVTTEQGEKVLELRRGLLGKIFGCGFDYYDKEGNLAIGFKPVSCCMSWRLDVSVEGKLAAKLQKTNSWSYSSTFAVTDLKNNKILKIKLPAFALTSFECPLLDMQDRQVGCVTIEFGSGSILTPFYLAIYFPLDLEVQYKAAVIGFCIVVAAQSANRGN